MPIGPYRRVLAIPALRQALLLGLLVRIPIFAGGVVLTLHVVQSLGRSYAAAGLVTAAATVAIAVSGPWRGRLLDRRGLRRVVLPSLVVTAVCWSVAPFVGYWPLLGLAALAGLFVVPRSRSSARPCSPRSPEADRRTALALDSVAVEMSFMVGPVLGVWAATIWPTLGALRHRDAGRRWPRSLCGWPTQCCAQEPPTAADGRDGIDAGTGEGAAQRAGSGRGSSPSVRRRQPPRWSCPGRDIAIVAALRDLSAAALIGPVLAVWGLGSIVGGLVYGAWHRSFPAFCCSAG